MNEVDLLTLTRHSLRGVLALVSRTFFLNVISFGSFLLISALLLPSQFGIYTAVIAAQRIVSFFTDFGLGAALIQKKEELSLDDLRTAFTIQSGLTLLVFLIIFLLRGYIQEFLKLESDGLNLLLVLIFTIFLSSFKTIPSILLERKIRFDKLVLPQIAEVLIFNIILITLMLKNFGIESFSWAFLVSSIAGIPLYYFISPWRIGVGINKKSLVHLKFGLQFQAKNVLATIKDDLLTVILVRLLTFTEIGYVGFAQRISLFAYRYVVDSVTKVTFSAYSRIQSDLGVLKLAIEKSLFFTTSLMFPILTGLILTGPYVIKYLPVWHKWEPAILSLIFFSLNALVSSVSAILINLMDATGRVKKTLYLMVLWTVLTWVLTPIFIFIYGYNGVAIASFLISLTVGITIYMARKIVKFNLLKTISKPFFCSFIMAVIVYEGIKLFVSDMPSLGLVIGLGAASYLVLYSVIARNEIQRAFAVLRKRT